MLVGFGVVVAAVDGNWKWFPRLGKAHFWSAQTYNSKLNLSFDDSDSDYDVGDDEDVENVEDDDGD